MAGQSSTPVGNEWKGWYLALPALQNLEFPAVRRLFLEGPGYCSSQSAGSPSTNLINPSLLSIGLRNVTVENAERYCPDLILTDEFLEDIESRCAALKESRVWGKPVSEDTSLKLCQIATKKSTLEILQIHHISPTIIDNLRVLRFHSASMPLQRYGARRWVGGF